MRRALTVALLSAAIGMPTAVGVTEVCANNFDQAWAKRLRDIATWNAKHPDYVKAHNLTRDMHKETVHEKALLRERWAIACGGDEASGGIFGGTAEFLGGTGDTLDNEYYREPLDVYPMVLPSLLPDEEYPAYDGSGYTAVGLPDTGFVAAGGYWGGYGPMGYVSVGSSPSGPPSPPVVPIEPTPELSTFSLVAFGLAMLITRRRVKP